MASLLRVENLITAFDTDAGQLVAVDGVSFSVERGKTLGIVGESGCGKSVSAFSITRLLPQPHGKILGGRVLFEGRDLVTLPDDELRHIRGKQIGVIFQEPMTALNPVQRIGKQLTEAILLHDRISAADARERVIEMLKRVRIPAPETRIDEYPHQLSGGMRQRVMIAMALINSPKLLIADEPTTALDVTVQAQILELISDLQKEMGMAVVLITHDLGVIAETCDEVAVMYAGRIVERAEVHELFANPRHAYTRGLLESIPRLDSTPKTRLKVIAGNVPSIADFKPGCRFAERSGKEHSLEQLNTRPPFVEVSPNHWVEACPVCTVLEIANEIGSDRIQTTNTHHESTRRTAPPSTLESAQSYLRTSSGAGGQTSGNQSRESQCQAEFRALAAWAKSNGKLIASDRLEPPTLQGAEHRVYHDEKQGNAFKTTKAGSCGMFYQQGEPVSALPSEYFERWRLQNEIFRDTVELEGLIETPAGMSMVVSQRWITGNVPSEPDIIERMRSLGFVNTAQAECYYRASDDIAVMDCHVGNFLMDDDGLVVPIGVIPIYPDAGLKQRLGLLP